MKLDTSPETQKTLPAGQRTDHHSGPSESDPEAPGTAPATDPEADPTTVPARNTGLETRPPSLGRASDTFELYDLRVEVVAVEGKKMVCNHPEGSYFELRGENLTLPAGQSFPIYPLAALLPLLPAKQRPTHPHDWMTTDMEIACPDPHCGALFRITRTARRTFRHSEVTAVPLPAQEGAAGSSVGSSAGSSVGSSRGKAEP